MINLLGTLHAVLIDAGYSTRIESSGHGDVLCFEDDAVIGFVSLFEQPDELIGGWLLRETALLSQFAPRLQAAGEKAWNVYCVFLCESPATDVQTRLIGWIEENLFRTRKIAACNIDTR